MKYSSEHRLFGQIVMLVFFLGLDFGLVVLFLGYNFIQSNFDFMTPIFSWPLDAIQVIVYGALPVLMSGVSSLCSQFLKPPRRENSRSAFPRFIEHAVRILGFFLMSSGVSRLLEEPLDFALTNFKVSLLVELVSDIALLLLCMLGAGSLYWYLYIRDKHYTEQRGQAD